jgi:hypothetical protein
LFREAVLWSSSRSRTRAKARRLDVVQKPQGTFHPRVQKVGPEHFGIVRIDRAKARSQGMLPDFFGNILLPPPVLPHKRPALADALALFRQAIARHDLRDSLAAVERTGRHHRVVRKAFPAAGFATRVVHPFATKQFRPPRDPGNKTDDTDLLAISRAAVNGFALVAAGRDEAWQSLHLLTRYRRD